MGMKGLELYAMVVRRVDKNISTCFQCSACVYHTHLVLHMDEEEQLVLSIVPLH